jgi:hypothetical protein
MPFARVVLVALIGICALGCAASEDDEETSTAGDALTASRPPPGGYSWTKSTNEVRKSVPVKKNGDWQVVYSVRLSDLGAGERIAARGEVQLTVCQASDVGNGTTCKRIAPFAPRYTAKIVLASSANDANGKDVTGTSDITCTHLIHHCAVAIPEGITNGVSGTKFVNLVVSAVDDAATDRDVMEVNEGNGGVYVTRIDDTAKVHGDSVEGRQLSNGSMNLDQENDHPRKPHVTLQAKVGNVKRGDVIDVDALIEANTKGGGSKPAGCQGARDPLITSEVYVSKRDGDPMGSKIGVIDEKNGKNCAIGDTCNYRKSGSVQLPKDTPKEVFVSVVSWGGRSCSAPNDEWKLGGSSKLDVGVRRQP